nr:hypothetical protein [uncultured Blautia sp.]
MQYDKSFKDEAVKLSDNTYADGCLTRITDKHHTYRLEMNGINMRETERCNLTVLCIVKNGNSRSAVAELAFRLSVICKIFIAS